ncbi:MAG: type II toxin-antitoxin system HicA family toxin [candidate division KSB1 bacterium]|nr:type II toxin-antitoxin system HicA family toxin [candidate division KSB1 bacterium]MDZ7357688.1 type II toxin-antitoxin system HicA family toxin [candidate division KSB1 bacterium]MDZ7375190.1 type II toxin-antitoxin system HicA family toxin [candidate division KSB1 bacterium]MDZ7401294.1 type II toxin-antitoxin system HicA family toxin [candidate division KSB1 bacterium]
MAIYTFDQFRKVLKKLEFEKVRSQKHETWRKILPNGAILRVRISHQHKKDIPKWLFFEMLRQAGIDEDQFNEYLKK